MAARSRMSINPPAGVKGVKGSVKGINAYPSRLLANNGAEFSEVLRVLRVAPRACARIMHAILWLDASASRVRTYTLHTLHTLNKLVVERVSGVKGMKKHPSHPSQMAFTA